MLKRVICISAVILLSCGSLTHAFDGKRKGFVLGGGLGFAPHASWDAEETDADWIAANFKGSNAGVGVNLVIGYAWDEHNMIVYEGNVVGYQPPSSVNVTQGFNGACWYHYYGRKGRSFFTSAGLGFYVCNFDIDYVGEGENDPGFGMLLGGGYEFARHFQIGAYLGLGRTSDVIFDYTHTHFSVLIGGVAF